MRFYKSFYLSSIFYIACVSICFAFCLSYFIPVLFVFAKNFLLLVLILVVADILFLYTNKKGIKAKRNCNERFSNGDENFVTIEIKNNFFFPITCKIIDELPANFLQNTKQYFSLKLKVDEENIIKYTITPNQRGEYNFGNTLVIVNSPLRLVSRRFEEKTQENVFVYPSYLQMRKFSLQGVSNNILFGNKKVRKLGNSLEFEQIKEYVQGDDYRTINWKATARKNQLMVNTYIDEKSQYVYCLVDKSRNMKMPFEGMTLLDYAINSTLAISNVAIQKQDKIGLLTFAEKMDSFLQADSKPMQMEAVLQSLYKQNTQFKDADYEMLYAQIRGRIKQRSLLILYTNFESEHSLKRQLPYLKAIANYHLLVVVFFENTELKTLSTKKATNTEEIYIQTIADKFIYEKKLMQKLLRQNGITALLSTPANLTINSINKYLEIKNRQAI